MQIVGECIYRKESSLMMSNSYKILRNYSDLIMNDIKKKPPSPPKRHSESITVVADLHCTHIPPDPAPSTPPWTTEERQLIATLKAQGGSDSSFKVFLMSFLTIPSTLRLDREDA